MMRKTSYFIEILFTTELFRMASVEDLKVNDIILQQRNGIYIQEMHN